MTTTKATMIAITKHETHSYSVIILTFSPVILHCNSSFTLQWKLICIFFASESLWDLFYLVFKNYYYYYFFIQTESHKNYNHPHQFTQSQVINFFFHLDLLLALLWIHHFSIKVLKMLIHSVQQYSQLPETCTCQSLFHEFLEDESLL